VIADLGRTMDDEKATRAFAEQMVRECGTSARTFKSALIWVVAESAQPMREEARKILAWQAISDESADLKLDEAQKKQLCREHPEIPTRPEGIDLARLQASAAA
jgi:hypothetical protein